MLNKELNILSEERTEMLKQTSIEKKRVFEGTLRPKVGHTLFEYDVIKKELSKTKFKVDKVISFTDAQKGLTSQTKEVDGKENVIYVSALNEKNAYKKLKSLLEGE